MGGVLASSSASGGITYFTEDVHELSATRLAAATVWRHPVRRQRRGFLHSARSLFRTPHRPVPKRPERWAPDGWSGSRDGGGQHEVLYHRERRVVRVLGQEFPLPTNGDALVLLVDEPGGSEPPSVTVRTLAPMLRPGPTVDPSLDPQGQAALMAAAMQEEHRVWDALLRTDPEIRAFLEADPDSP